ncbi:thiolase family protein [Natronorubrum sp. FCH18a]|uniref:thiolase family protein n=1 Tax=Natronorubrum sp. FCH18a TaxID=3447018 RepID=UPI003F519618
MSEPDAGLAREAFIGGIGIHEFGRFDDKTFQEMGEEAVLVALNDANMSVQDIEIGFCSNTSLPTSAGLQVFERLGRTGIPISDLDAACAAGVLGLELGQHLVSSGQFDIVLAFGVEKMPRGFIDPRETYPDWMAHLGLSQNPQYWALNAQRHMHDYGTTEEQIAKVAVKNHANSVDNPNAHYTEEFSLEEIMDSQLVCDPLRLLELCAPNEGAAAAVVCSRDVLESFSIDDPVKIDSSVHQTSDFPVEQAASYCTTPTDNLTVHRTTAEKAYKAADITPNDVDIAEVQDTDAFSEIEAYEELGFCEQGEGGRLIDEGVTKRDGDLPVNVSGGLISKGEPIGASHLGQVHELVLQIRDEAGPRQVEDIKTGLAHVFGAYGQCGVTILSEP